MKIISEKNKAFNIASSHPLQSWEWGEFRKSWGNIVVRTEFGQIIFSKITPTNLTIGTFIKGPKPNKKQLEELKKIGKENKAIFIKLEPNVPANSLRSTDYQLLKKYCVQGKTLFTPTSFWIDLTKSEENLMNSFTPKTRYNIRLAQKHGVEVVEDNSDKAFENYIKLTRETVKRQGFYAHTEKYHRLMWEYLHIKPKAEGREPIARILTAKYKGEIITAWIVFIWKDFLYYPYGASSSNPNYKPLMANNLTMWEAIRFGKSLGLKIFDLWGREPGKGFTRFKEGYNPKVVEFLGSWDLVINPIIYRIYHFAENIRWFLLRIKTKLGIITRKF